MSASHSSDSFDSAELPALLARLNCEAAAISPADLQKLTQFVDAVGGIDAAGALFATLDDLTADQVELAQLIAEVWDDGEDNDLDQADNGPSQRAA